MIVYNSKGEKILIEDKPIGTAGAEGAVYKILDPINYIGHCVKVFHDTKRTIARKNKIEFMTHNKPSEIKSKNYIICWPEEIVYDKKNKFLGFIMSLAFNDSISLYELTTPNLNKKLPPKWKKFDRSLKEGIENRYKICVNISIAIHTVHSAKNYVIIDYKPQNILINNSGKLSVLDVDSFQISQNSKLLFNAVVATPEYAPPESHKLNPSLVMIDNTWDLFSIAVSYYEILFGIHPFAATSYGQYVNSNTLSEKIQKGLFVHGSKKNWLSVIPDIHNNFTNQPNSIKKLFLQTFENGHSAPKSRVLAETWGMSFAEEVLLSNSILPNSFNIKKRTTTVAKNKKIVSSNYNHPSSTNTKITIPSSTNTTTSKPKDDMPDWQAVLILIGVVLFFIFLFNISTTVFWGALIVVYIIYKIYGD